MVRSKEEIWCERRRLSYELKKKIGAQGGKDLLRWKENIWCERRKRFGAGSKSYNTNRGKKLALEGKDLARARVFARVNIEP